MGAVSEVLFIYDYVHNPYPIREKEGRGEPASWDHGHTFLLQCMDTVWLQLSGCPLSPGAVLEIVSYVNPLVPRIE